MKKKEIAVVLVLSFIMTTSALGNKQGKIYWLDIKEVAGEMEIPLSTAYRLKSRVKESLLAEVEALNDYLG